MQLADYLPHTPVSGYGVNFGFTNQGIGENLRSIIQPSDTKNIVNAGASLKDEHYRRSLLLNGRILNFTVGIIDEVLTLHFNFHFEIASLADFKSKILEDPILTLKQEAKILLEKSTV